MNSIYNFDKSFENGVSENDGDEPEVGLFLSKERLTEENYIEEIFSSMAWNG